jgi:phospholipid/cholesterol/gamma-HCH transport system substrate-binding protein
MEQSSKFKVRLGFFVASGLALLMIGIFYIGKQKNLFHSVFGVNTAFKNIGGLEVGSNVRFSGIKVGTVDNIRIVNDTTVRVHMIIDKDVQKFIKTDSYVNINSDGLIGDKIVNIGQGSGGEPVKEGQFLPSSEPVETDAILASLSVTGQNAEVVSGQLAEILYKVNHGNGTIAKLIKDTIIAENLRQMILNLKQGSKRLDENMEAAKHNIFFRGFFRKKEADREKKEQLKNGSVKKEPKEKHHKTWAEARAERKEARRKKAEQKEAEKKKANEMASRNSH